MDSLAQASVPARLPLVRLGRSDTFVTRLISGGNPLCGNSHFSAAMSEEMRAYFSASQVVQYLHRVQAAGINAIQARGDFHRILHWLELFKREGGKLHFIAQTASEMADVFANIRVLAAAGAAAIYHHGTRTDSLWAEGRIDEVRGYLSCMRDAGVQVGLRTHIPEVIEYAEERDWDVDFYMASFYNLSRRRRESALVSDRGNPESELFLPEDPGRMAAAIQATPKMCLAFKVLAAGRHCGTQEQVQAALDFAYAQIKPWDAVVVGMFPKYEDQIGLNVEHAIAACQKAQREASGA